MTWWHGLGIMLAGLAGGGGALAAALPPAVTTALVQAGIPVEAVALRVEAVEAGQGPVLAWQDGTAFNPASVMKLATAYAALKALGPGHTWETRLGWARWPVAGRLDGNLYLAGSGDPVLGYERLWTLLRQARALGIDTIEGDLVWDGGAWQLPDFDPGAFDGQPLRPYNSGPGALTLNFNALRLTLVPRPGSDEAVVLADPPLAGFSSSARVALVAGACGRWQQGLSARMVDERLTVEGRFPRACGARDWHVAPWPAARFNTALIAALWRELGGRLTGRVRAGQVPEGVSFPLSSVSPPLADVVRDMNKWSNNLIARQLLASLGARMPLAAADTVNAGRDALTRTLAADGIDVSVLVLENGAGLSRVERISARALTQLLRAAWASGFMPEFLAALPVAGVDGTAWRRLRDSGARGRARIKTGTLDGVSAMAGYVQDAGGRWWAVAMLVNHPQAGASQPAQDALIEWVWQGGERP